MPKRGRVLVDCGGGGTAHTAPYRDGFVDLRAGVGMACCGRRQELEQKRPRKRRGSEVTPVVERHQPPSLLPPPPPKTKPPRPALLPASLAGPVDSPARTNRRKPRSFEAPATPKVANVRKPRSFGAEGWLKVDLPVEAEDQTWYRRVRNIVTAERPGGVAAPGELVPLHCGLYVGDRADAQNTEQLHRLGITHVLNCATARETGTGAGFYIERSTSRAGAAPVVYMELGAADSEAADFIAPNLPVRPASCVLRPASCALLPQKLPVLLLYAAVQLLCRRHLLAADRPLAVSQRAAAFIDSALLVSTHELITATFV